MLADLLPLACVLPPSFLIMALVFGCRPARQTKCRRAAACVQLFAATAPLLDDPAENLLAVSAFNDDGLAGFVDGTLDAGRLVRSDFFPGLGWMLTRSLWQELQPKWPDQYWDDWLRGPENRRGREMIRPAISRTLHYGIQGTSNNQFGSHLDRIVLADEDIALAASWATFDAPSMSKAVYERRYLDNVRSSEQVQLEQLRRPNAALSVNKEWCVPVSAHDAMHCAGNAQLSDTAPVTAS